MRRCAGEEHSMIVKGCAGIVCTANPGFVCQSYVVYKTFITELTWVITQDKENKCEIMNLSRNRHTT